MIVVDASAVLVTADKRLCNKIAATPYARHVVHLSQWERRDG